MSPATQAVSRQPSGRRLAQRSTAMTVTVNVTREPAGAGGGMFVRTPCNPSFWPGRRAAAGAGADGYLRCSRRRAVSIAALASWLGVTRQHLGRAFRAQVGVSPKAFARIARFVQRRAVPVAAVTSVGLVALASPFLGARFEASDARSLPRSSEARAVALDLAEGADLVMCARREEPLREAAAARLPSPPEVAR